MRRMKVKPVPRKPPQHLFEYRRKLRERKSRWPIARLPGCKLNSIKQSKDQKQAYNTLPQSSITDQVLVALGCFHLLSENVKLACYNSINVS